METRNILRQRFNNEIPHVWKTPPTQRRERMEIKQLALLAPISWAQIHQLLRSNADETPAIVQVSRPSGTECSRQTRWFHCGGGKVHHMACGASFCCGCGSIKAESEVHWGLSTRRRVWQFCRTCETEVCFVFELTPGIERTLERFNPHAHTWKDGSGNSFFNVG